MISSITITNDPTGVVVTVGQNLTVTLSDLTDAAGNPVTFTTPFVTSSITVTGPTVTFDPTVLLEDSSAAGVPGFESVDTTGTFAYEIASGVNLRLHPRGDQTTCISTDVDCVEVTKITGEITTSP